MEKDNLYTIVKSLTRTEKAYFKKFASRHVLGNENKYVILFDAISSITNGYDEKEIKKKFRNEKFVKNFPVMKRYLTEMILKSLQSYYSDSSPENEIKNEIRYIEILYKKGLFRSCLKILNRLLKRAYKSENFLAILDLLRWKKNLIHEGIFKGDEFVHFKQAYNEEQEIISKIKNLSDHRLLSYKAKRIALGTDSSLHGEKVKRELLALLDDPLLLSEEKALSNTATITYYHTRAVLYECLGENVRVMECRKSVINTLERNPELLKGNINNYIITIYNILGVCLMLENYIQLEQYIKKLRLATETYSNKVSDKDMLYILIGSSIYELRMYINRGEFGKIHKNLVQIEEGINKYSNMIVRTDQLYIFYLLGYGYFGIGDIKEALRMINIILNDKEVTNDNIMTVKSKLLNLILHYELGNLELLDYLTKSTQRFISKSTFSGTDEKVMIKFLQGLEKISSEEQLQNLYRESLSQLKKYDNLFKPDDQNEFEVQNNFTNTVEFDLKSWFESKISGKRFEDVVRAKYNRK